MVVCSGVAARIGVLVDPKSPDRADPSSVVHERPAVSLDRAPGGVPPDPVLTSHRGNRADELADLPGDLGTGPDGEDLPRCDPFDPLRPRLRAAPLRPASPTPFADDQTGWSPEAVEVPELDVHPVLGLRPPPARPARRPGLGRLDRHHPLTGCVVHLEHHQPGQSEHLLRQPDTVIHRQGPPSFWCWNTATMSRSLTALVDGRSGHGEVNPQSFRKSLITSLKRAEQRKGKSSTRGRQNHGTRQASVRFSHHGPRRRVGLTGGGHLTLGDTRLPAPIGTHASGSTVTVDS